MEFLIASIALVSALFALNKVRKLDRKQDALASLHLELQELRRQVDDLIRQSSLGERHPAEEPGSEKAIAKEADSESAKTAEPEAATASTSPSPPPLPTEPETANEAEVSRAWEILHELAEEEEASLDRPPAPSGPPTLIPPEAAGLGMKSRGPSEKSEEGEEAAESSKPEGKRRLSSDASVPLRHVAKKEPTPAADAEAASPSEENSPPEDAIETPKGLGLEVAFGSTWLLRIGLVLIAIAAGIFAITITPSLGPGIKTLLAYSGALSIFFVGFLFERSLRRFARPVMAGGLSLGFFVSFAAHFVPQMQCVSLLASIGWMLASIGPVLFFAERWKSQGTAGLALFLGHVSAFVAGRYTESNSSVALVLVSFLSSGAVVLYLRHNWSFLSLFGVVLAYVSHISWVAIDRADPVPASQAFWANFVFLCSYYFIFAVGDVLWWRRGQSDSSGETRAKTSAAHRVLGPANLLIFVAVTALVFIKTEVYLESIHWFLIPLGLIQGAIYLPLRRSKSPDALFYVALAVILGTLGLISAFEELTLNLVLAAEAMALLVAAHMTRLRLFHVLSQAALAANFIHYWIFTDSRAGSGADPVGFAYFLGGLLTVSVYLLKARFEEIWYGSPGDESPWKEGGSLGPLIEPIVEPFKVAYNQLVKVLPYVHAIGGAVILIDQSALYFGAGDSIVAVSIFSVVLLAAALWWRSLPLATGYIAVGIGLLFLLVEALPPDATTTRGPAGLPSLGLLGLPLYELFREISRWQTSYEWNVSEISLWFVWLLGSVGALAFSFSSPGPSWSTKRTNAWLAFGQVSVWLSVAIAALIIFDGPAGDEMFLPWLIPFALLFVNQDWLNSKLFIGSGTTSGHRVLSEVLNLPLFVLSYLLVVLIDGVFHYELAEALWFAGLAIALLAISISRLNFGFYLCALLILFFGLSITWGSGDALPENLGEATGADYLEAIIASGPLFLLSHAAYALALASGARLASSDSRPLLSFQWKWGNQIAIAVAALGFAIYLFLADDVYYGRTPGQVVWLAVVAAISIGFAGWARNAGAYVAGTFLLVSIYGLVFDDRDFARSLLDTPLAASAVIGLTLLIAWGQDAALSRNRAKLKIWVGRVAWAAVYLPYALGTFYLITAFEDWFAFPWWIVATGVAALGVYCATAPIGLTRGVVVSSILTSIAAGLWLVNRSNIRVGGGETLWAAGLIASTLIAAERLAAAYPDPGLAKRSERLLPLIRSVFVGLLTLIAGLTIYWSDAIGARWITAWWALVASVLVVLGFSFRFATYRRSALLLLGLCLVRVFLVDTQGLDRIYRAAAFLAVGLCCLAIAGLYTRYASTVRKWL